VCRRAVNLLTLVFNLAKFLTDYLRLVLEPFLTGRKVSVELWVVPPEAVPSLALLLDDPELSC
jgi:hypothetical protein